MKKWPLYILLMMCMIWTANAALFPLCGDSTEANVSCMMVTPVISCTNTSYILTDTNGTIVSNSTLTHLQGDIYYFNFSEGNGDYIVTLCDDTTRQIQVKPSNDTMIGIAIILGMLMIFLLLATGFFAAIKHNIMYMLLLFDFIFAAILVNIAANLASASNYTFAGVLWTIQVVMVIFIFIMFIITLLHFTNRAFHIGKTKKQEKIMEEMGENEEYDDIRW